MASGAREPVEVIADRRVTLLDCTLRDGGYYTSWDFEPGLVGEYLRGVAHAGVDVVELGFRSLQMDGYRGPYWYTTDELLDRLELPEGVTYGVMVNAAEVVDDPSLVDSLFGPSGSSRIGLVRLAAHFGEFERCGRAIERLRGLGYRVGMNLMQAGTRTSDEIASAVSSLVSSVPSGSIDVMYLADSLGNMDERGVAHGLAAVRRGWHGDLGFHAHDNTGRAVANAVAAMDAGAVWIDGTIAGMGRGAGNAGTEYLLAELGSRGLESYRAMHVLGLVSGGFGALKSRYGWGHNVHYHLAALRGLHPTYVQELLAGANGESGEIADAIEELAGEGAGRYQRGALQAALAARYATEHGAWSIEGLGAPGTVMLVASTPGLAQHADAVSRFIEHERPLVMGLNRVEGIDDSLIDVTAACHPSRLAALARGVPASGARRLMAPAAAMPAEILSGVRAGHEVLDYGLRVETEVLRFGRTGCALPSPLVCPYALSAAAAAGATRVLLAGFDGYAARDPRRDEMNRVLRMFEAAAPGVSVEAITPTGLDVRERSVYARGLGAAA